ncbi:MAG: RNA polymerase sigma factor, partial [Myxococcota bacterium]|nr:RNA polymerase sigma factor [Myxococcota bacterium]
DGQPTNRDVDAPAPRSDRETPPAPQEGPLSVACPTVDELPAVAETQATSSDFDALYREQRGRVLATVRSVLGPSDEIDDVVQLVFIEVHRSLDRFQGRSKLSTWIYRIAVNVALQHIRRKKRRRWLLLGPTGDEADRRPCATNSERRLEDRELLERVYAAAERLSEKKRAVWVLHELKGLGPPEIAEILEIPVNTVRSRLLAARREISTWLERDGVLRGSQGR